MIIARPYWLVATMDKVGQSMTDLLMKRTYERPCLGDIANLEVKTDGWNGQMDFV